MWVVARYAHRVIVMSEGKIIADTTPRNLFGNRSLLESVGLRAPEIAVWSKNLLKQTVLSAKELLSCLEAG
jgi:ABC-type cobalamin/Fe3+-siderophores transport system ATPase subunit